MHPLMPIEGRTATFPHPPADHREHFLWATKSAQRRAAHRKRRRLFPRGHRQGRLFVPASTYARTSGSRSVRRQWVRAVCIGQSMDSVGYMRTDATPSSIGCLLLRLVRGPGHEVRERCSHRSVRPSVTIASLACGVCRSQKIRRHSCFVIGEAAFIKIPVDRITGRRAQRLARHRH
jgi:hypothetical protein